MDNKIVKRKRSKGDLFSLFVGIGEKRGVCLCIQGTGHFYIPYRNAVYV